MNTVKLTVRPCWNPYYINNQQVQEIRFYQDGKVLNDCTLPQGYFPTSVSCNRRPADDIEAMDIEIRRTVTAGMKGKKAFYIASEKTLYLNTALFESFEVLGEQEANKIGDTKYFANFFNITTTLDGKKDTYRIQAGHYTGNSKEGKYHTGKYDIEKFFAKRDVENSRELAELLVDNKDEVIRMLNDTQASTSC